MSHFLKIGIAAITLLALSACTRTTPLQDAMQDMAQGLKTLARAKQENEREQGLAQFKLALTMAKTMQVKPEDQADYDKGLVEIGDTLAELEAAIQTGDRKVIGEVVKKIKKIKDSYHEKIIDEPQR
ncbi:hypothetical protein C2869_21255 [Saccharobesus litoralis]|uniref:Cytochrome b562 n=1 Tax=Saccharobesus litoralis TaxID=2172099 RepID=A0A2S0VX34_9ALTE|nr:cytochrome b562 [Saccharobesus litoralis]AWB68769.1 hypothetical protein C2869_21255 [Saccharobesus litoralis]